MTSRLTRIEVPIFYTPKNRQNSHNASPGQVFAMTDEHRDPSWITVGHVSKQTPIGQGTFCGFRRSELRHATKAEVRVAVTQNHPHGPEFRPNCAEAMAAQFHLAMSRAVANWTNDRPGKTPPIRNVSREDIKKAGESALMRHLKILAAWPLICWWQRRKILKSLAS